MSQSSLTVTTPNPTPPTNMACTGATPPNVPNYTKNTYLNYVGVGNGGVTPAPLGLWSAVANPPPFFDDGAGGVAGMGPAFGGPATTLPAFMAPTAALASGTAATSGGTENTYPGTGSVAGSNFLGAVPASTSLAHEAAGQELNYQKIAGANATDYNPNTFLPYTGAGGAIAGATGTWQGLSTGVGPALTAASIAAGPNANHASSLSPAVNPTLTTISPTTSVHATAAITMTATGVGFTRQSRIVIGGVPQVTTFVSSTSLTCLATPPLLANPTLAVTVVTGGVVTTLPQTWNIT